MKFKESGSLTDTDILDFSLSSNSAEILNEKEFFTLENSEESIKLVSPFKSESADDTKVTILPLSPRSPKMPADSKNHDKVYYDERFDNSIFDPSLALTSLPKVLVSIGGMLLTGFFLNFILTWNVFTNVPELFILIPVIYNLRGILEQGLASRLSKASRIGVMESISGRRKIWLGNLNLVMFQSITAGLFAGLMSCFLAWVLDSKGLPLWRSILIVVVAAATTASTCVISGFFLFLVLQFFKWLKKNPEDLLGPLTNSFGGFISLFILAVYAGFFYLWMGSWIGVAAVAGLLIVSNVYFYTRARANEAVSSLASEGWPSMISSLLVTGLSGLLLQRFISEYQGRFALFLPVFTGITGNFAGIYCSEAMTHLHLFQLNSLLPRKTALTLLIMSNPLQFILLLLIGAFNSSKATSVSGVFFVSYLFAGNVQILLLIALADFLIKATWKFSLKPESHVPALMSTLSDLSGTLMLVGVFYLLGLGQNVPQVADPMSSVLEQGREVVSELSRATQVASAIASPNAVDSL